MNEIVTINNVRGYIDEKGTAWLNLEDVARGLGFTQIKNKKEYIRWETVISYCNEFSQQVGKESFIPENVFYKLCMKANNEVARTFQDLVCDEILPNIRKNGGYIITQENDTPEMIMARAVLVAEKTINEQKEKIKILAEENKTQKQMITELKPAKEYLDKILSTEDTMAITQIAADYGISGIRLNKILHDERFIRNVNGQWLLYSEHMNKGYTKSETTPIKTKDGRDKTVILTKWTQKGRLKIHNILTNLGFLANMDKEKKIS
jgi:BRO domain-containing protein